MRATLRRSTCWINRMMGLTNRRTAIKILHAFQDFLPLPSSCAPYCHQATIQTIKIDDICRLINNHPFPFGSLDSVLRDRLPLPVPSSLLEDLLGRLFSGHVNGLKALELFDYARSHPDFRLSQDAFDKMIHILSRMQKFDVVWRLLDEVHEKKPTVVTLKSMSIILARYCRHRSFEEAIEAFDRMQNYVGEHTVDTYNVLLYAFCTQKHMMEARAVFRKMYKLFMPNTRTLNILLMGFKESGNLTAVELFYHDLIRRGCKPNTVTYNIRIDSFCKKGCVDDALRLIKEMETHDCCPTIETYTTLIHGFCIIRNPERAHQVLDESDHNLKFDIAGYNALISCYVRVGDMESAMNLMDEMEQRGIGHDDVTYKTLFRGLKASGSIGAVHKLYRRMVEKEFVPSMTTNIMLMKFFCGCGRYDLGIDLWDYLYQRGCCPHTHMLDLLVRGLCSVGKLDEAYTRLTELVAKGRHPNKHTFQVLQCCFQESGDEIKRRGLNEMNRLKQD